MFMNLAARKPVVTTILGGPFKGARVYLNPANSMRKIFGLYEHVLNGWIAVHTPGKQFVLDIGANTGYDTYGFAHLLIKSHSENPIVLAFEPNICAELETPRHWNFYSGCKIEIIEKFVGSQIGPTMTTLNQVYDEYDLGGCGLIKMDIEGGEVDALIEANKFLDNPNHDWLIEIHGEKLIPKIAMYFVDRGRPFLIRDLSPVPILGPEQRSINTYWLMTI